MDRTELIAAARALLQQSHVVCAAVDDRVALAALAIADLPADTFEGDPPAAALRAALSYLREELVAILDGRVLAVNVLRDEMACVERLVQPYASGDRPQRLPRKQDESPRH